MLAAGLAVIYTSEAPAQNYPMRSVSIIVPYAAGGGTDLFARMLGQKLEQRLSKSFVIENRPGGGTIIAAQAAAKAPPDGSCVADAGRSRQHTA